MLKKLVSLLFASVLFCTMLTHVAEAAERNGERYIVDSYRDHNDKIHQKRLALQEKYGIDITYPDYSINAFNQAAAIHPETLETLDKALSYVTAPVVRAISRHYAETTGKYLEISYQFSDMGNRESVNMRVGGFNDQNATIMLYIPEPGQGAVITGDTPMTVLHELGHALHIMLIEKHGLWELESIWENYNDGHEYTGRASLSNPDTFTFASGYAVTSYYEDFAETFAYAFGSGRPGMGLGNRLSSGGKGTNFGKKVATMESLLVQYFPENTTMHANLRKSLTAASELSHNGMVFSGRYLQFSGYPEPRYLPISFLDEFRDIPESAYTWVPAVGGWTARRDHGEAVLIFPDLFYQQVG